jgi:predicted RNA-binding Zn-ribbon protein involved in translation (DUF1610 family)
MLVPCAPAGLRRRLTKKVRLLGFTRCRAKRIMSERFHCPKCSIELPFGNLTSECPQCGQSFSISSGVRPALYKTHNAPSIEPTQEKSISLVGATVALIVRLAIGAVALLAILLAAAYGNSHDPDITFVLLVSFLGIPFLIAKRSYKHFKEAWKSRKSKTSIKRI